MPAHWPWPPLLPSPVPGSGRPRREGLERPLLRAGAMQPGALPLPPAGLVPLFSGVAGVASPPIQCGLQEQAELGLSDLSRCVRFVQGVVSECAHLHSGAAGHPLKGCPHPPPPPQGGTFLPFLFAPGPRPLMGLVHSTQCSVALE